MIPIVNRLAQESKIAESMNYIMIGWMSIYLPVYVAIDDMIKLDDILFEEKDKLLSSSGLGHSPLT